MNRATLVIQRVLSRGVQGSSIAKKMAVDKTADERGRVFNRGTAGTTDTKPRIRTCNLTAAGSPSISLARMAPLRNRIDIISHQIGKYRSMPRYFPPVFLLFRVITR